MKATISLDIEYLSVEPDTDENTIHNFFGKDGCEIRRLIDDGSEPYLSISFNTNHDVYSGGFMRSGQTIYYETQPKNKISLNERRYLYQVMDTKDFLKAIRRLHNTVIVAAEFEGQAEVYSQKLASCERALKKAQEKLKEFEFRHDGRRG